MDSLWYFVVSLSLAYCMASSKSISDEFIVQFSMISWIIYFISLLIKFL